MPDITIILPNKTAHIIESITDIIKLLIKAYGIEEFEIVFKLLHKNQELKPILASWFNQFSENQSTKFQFFAFLAYNILCYKSLTAWKHNQEIVKVYSILQKISAFDMDVDEIFECLFVEHRMEHARIDLSSKINTATESMPLQINDRIIEILTANLIKDIFLTFIYETDFDVKKFEASLSAHRILSILNFTDVTSFFDALICIRNNPKLFYPAHIRALKLIFYNPAHLATDDSIIQQAQTLLQNPLKHRLLKCLVQTLRHTPAPTGTDSSASNTHELALWQIATAIVYEEYALTPPESTSTMSSSSSQPVLPSSRYDANTLLTQLEIDPNVSASPHPLAVPPEQIDAKINITQLIAAPESYSGMSRMSRVIEQLLHPLLTLAVAHIHTYLQQPLEARRSYSGPLDQFVSHFGKHYANRYLAYVKRLTDIDAFIIAHQAELGVHVVNLLRAFIFALTHALAPDDDAPRTIIGTFFGSTVGYSKAAKTAAAIPLCLASVCRFIHHVGLEQIQSDLARHLAPLQQGELETLYDAYVASMPINERPTNDTCCIC